MNVTELARRLKMTTSELLAKLPELGFDIGKRAIKVSPDLVDKIISAIEADRKKSSASAVAQAVTEIKLSDKNGSAEPKKEFTKIIKIPEVIIVKDFAEKLGLSVVKVIGELMKNGIMTSLNERIDLSTATIIGEDLGFKVEAMSEDEVAGAQVEVSDQKLKEVLKNIKSENAIIRPPVVVVMGHVDHGKTKLLDAIRETNIIDQESGGITQAIGAYQAQTHGQLITFLDTPGHEAFKSMRSRGSKIADVAIIVVAADDGLKPQTMEVIDLVQKEQLPFVIAINKIDKEGADIDRVKKELSEINLIPEDWGGKTICVPISAKEKKGLNELLDMVLLVADMEDLKSDPTVRAIGTIIEAHVDKGEGPVATVLIQAGTLRPGDLIVAGQVAGKIRLLRNFKGEDAQEALPSMPVKILGLREVPRVGDILEVTDDKKMVKELLKKASYKKEAHARFVQNSAVKEEEGAVVPTLNLIIKADVLGSQEAIEESLSRFVDPEVKVKVIKKGLGNVTDADVLAAQAGLAIIVAFKVKNFPGVEELARDKKVELKYYEIIYKLLEDVEERLKTLLKPEVIRTELGQIQILAIFRTEKNSMIAGGKILTGVIKPKTKAKVIRAGEFITMGDLTELRAGKQIVNEAHAGEECGFKFIGEPIIKEHDVLEVYQEEIKERQLQVKHS
ncbi:MAG: translation initiation factor IF-2 [Patescibacteria group bacterium]|jgi:translation initiation factor IF-2